MPAREALRRGAGPAATHGLAPAKKTHLDCRVALRSNSLALLGASLVCMVPRRALASHPTLVLLGTAGKSGRCGRFLVRFSNKLQWTRRCLCCLSSAGLFFSITELCINSQQNYSLRLLVQLASPGKSSKKKNERSVVDTVEAQI